VSLVNSTADTLEKPRQETGQTEHGLVAFCDIRPGNGAGIFLQPRRRNHTKYGKNLSTWLLV